jgi:hypothetical protein
MSRGGRRPGAGRKPGAAWASKKIPYKQLEQARDSGMVLPLDVMEDCERYFYNKSVKLFKSGNEKGGEEALKEAALWAEKCAKFRHPTLQAVAVRSETATQYVARLPAPVKDIEEWKLQVVSLLKH